MTFVLLLTCHNFPKPSQFWHIMACLRRSDLGYIYKNPCSHRLARWTPGAQKLFHHVNWEKVSRKKWASYFSGAVSSTTSSDECHNNSGYWVMCAQITHWDTSATPQVSKTWSDMWKFQKVLIGLVNVSNQQSLQAQVNTGPFRQWSIIEFAMVWCQVSERLIS